MAATPYRDPATVRAIRADELAAVGRQRRSGLTHDPHAMRAPHEVSDPRSTAFEEFAESAAGVLASRQAVRRLPSVILAVIGVPLLAVSAGVAYVAREVFHSILAIPIMVAVTVGGAGYAIARYSGRHRRWLAAIPLRVDGFLELIGREERVVRLLAKVHFRDAAPDLEYVKDVLTGAGCATEGVQLLPDGSLGIHSPALAGDGARVHGWVRATVGDALVALDEVRTIRLVELQER